MSSWSRNRFCETCHTEIRVESITGLHGWCLRCRDIVDVRSCKAPYWTIGATFVLALAIPLTCA